MTKEVKQISGEERFTQSAINKYESLGIATGGIITEDQKKYIKKYFIYIDNLVQAHVPRFNQPKLEWNNIKDLDKLMIQVINNSQCGLDPSLDNHVSFIPYFDKSTGKYEMQQRIGYNGRIIRHNKWGLNKIDRLITRLVYSNEKFRPIFSDGTSEDKFEHIPSKNPFDKGSVIGGYIYKKYSNGNTSLDVIPVEEIEKRKPKTAAAEFWGGEKDEWVNGQKTGRKIKIEGWEEQMMLKTLINIAYSSNREPLDASKLPEIYEHKEDDYDVETHDVPHENVNVEPEIIEEEKEELESQDFSEEF